MCFIHVCVLVYSCLLLTFLYHRQSSDIELNEVWESVSKKPYTEGHDDSKKASKTLQAESEELYYKYVYTQGICPDDRSFQSRRKYRHSADMHDSADIHRNTKEWNITHI